MWVSIKKWNELVKRIAELEKTVQSQLSVENIAEKLADGMKKAMRGCNLNKDITPQDIDYLRSIAEKSTISALANHKTSEQKQ